MKFITMPISEEQANQLLQLLDLAVKTGGLQVAAPALEWHNKLQSAFKAQEAPKSE